MKFLKNIFGSKQNKNSKFKSNTLAEANGSPDLRLATTKEKESDVPVLKKEEVNLKKYRDFKDAYNAIFEFIESWYNRERIHSSLNYRTPDEVYSELEKSLAA